ncbi:MAG: TRAP transporter small permease [Rhodospirillales bacterium]|nr:TRAP transporter small permease [Rhodospirillales bacterium]
MIRFIDGFGEVFGRLAGWLYFATGVMIVWEVVARYVFVAPTIWAEELSRVLLVWGTFLPLAALLRRRENIRITALLERLSADANRVAECMTLMFILAISAVVVWYGWIIAIDSWRVGRTTGTMLDIPNWWMEVAVPLAFLLLGLQSLVELLKLIVGETTPSEEAD